MSSTTTSTSNSSPVPKKDEGGRSDSRSGSRLNHHSSPFHQGSFRSSSPSQPPLPEANCDQQQPLRPRNVIHIVTKDFPQYFAIVSRPRQDIATVGPEGAILASQRVPKAQVYHKPKYVTCAISTARARFRYARKNDPQWVLPGSYTEWNVFWERKFDLETGAHIKSFTWKAL